MPLEPHHWLLKSPALVRHTFRRPHDAAAWYSEQFRRHADILSGSYAPLPTPADLTRHLAAPADLTGGWWTTGGRFLSLNLIACGPHSQWPHPCPGERPMPG
ncbi:hypothetical protein AB0O07_34520 [Streptomyces sp. NPDC093085]|uniref:hypothetical protein n=1 Tax=Streptomyces sp. NPDC093085 TaxID=3155068 RepID=UPI0034280CE4